MVEKTTIEKKNTMVLIKICLLTVDIIYIVILITRSYL